MISLVSLPCSGQVFWQCHEHCIRLKWELFLQFIKVNGQAMFDNSWDEGEISWEKGMSPPHKTWVGVQWGLRWCHSHILVMILVENIVGKDFLDAKWCPWQSSPHYRGLGYRIWDHQRHLLEAWKVNQCKTVFNVTTSIYKCTTDTSGVLISNPH